MVDIVTTIAIGKYIVTRVTKQQIDNPPKFKLV